MTVATDHYAQHLAPIYAWMDGGFDAAFSEGAAQLQLLGVPRGPGHAVDLGAGFGKHAIPLAKAGYRVTAVDASAHLLGQLREQRASLDIETCEAELSSLGPDRFRNVDLVLCLGDTLTHLESQDQVGALMAGASRWLKRGGRLLATFRNYLRTPEGDGRFIPVRADADRILTCFLETRPDRVVVHDLVHERVGGEWQQRVSSYSKLRLDPEWVRAELERCGLRADVRAGPRGMVAVCATAA